MSLKTKIQWCDSTVNPTMGCDGCEIWGAQRKTCYAGTLHVRFGGVKPGYAARFEDVALFPGRVAEACSWSDLAGKRSAEWRLFGPVYDLAFAPDGRHLGTANANGTVYLFRLPASRPPASGSRRNDP